MRSGALSFFPECVARVPVSLWGCVRSTLRSCSQPSATVRNRSREERMAVPCRAYGEFCKSGHFWRFQMSRSFVPRGRRGTLSHSNLSDTVSKMVLCGRRNTFASDSGAGQQECATGLRKSGSAYLPHDAGHVWRSGLQFTDCSSMLMTLTPACEAVTEAEAA